MDELTAIQNKVIQTLSTFPGGLNLKSLRQSVVGSGLMLKPGYTVEKFRDILDEMAGRNLIAKRPGR